MRKMRRLLIFVLTMIMTVSLMACGQVGGSAKNVSKDKILRVHLPSTVDTLDSQVAIYDTSYEVIANINEGLLRVSKDENIAYGVAESYDVSDDGTVYTFKLRKAYWSNGTQVTANDFVFGWLRALDPETGSEYEYLLGDYIKNADEYYNGKCTKEEVGIQAKDDLTLEVELKEPCAYFLSLLYLPVYYPVNKDFYNECGDLYATDAKHTLSNGPFMMSSYTVKDTSFELKKNEKYWNSKSIQIDGLKYQVIEDTQQALIAYENNELDIATIYGEQAERYKDSEELHNVETAVQWFLRPNIKKVKELQNLNLRKALYYCLNREEIVNDILKNSSIVADYFVPTGFTFDENGEDFQNASIKSAGVDKNQAQEYWNKAKEELGINKLELTLLYSSLDTTTKIATYLKSEIEEVIPEVKINLRQLPRESCVDALMSGDFEIGLTCWAPDYSDPAAFLNVMVTGNVCNCGGWSNQKFDDLMGKAQSDEYVLEPNERWIQLKDAEKCLLDDVAVFPLYQEGKVMLIKPNVKGIQFSSVAINRIYTGVTVD